MKRLTPFLWLWLCLAAGAWAQAPVQLPVHPPDMHYVSEQARQAYYSNGLRVLEYWAGQDALLDHVARDFPSLAGQAAAARLDFQRAFGRTRENLQARLAQVPEVRDRFRHQVDSSLALYRPPYTLPDGQQAMETEINSLRDRLLAPHLEEYRCGLLAHHPDYLAHPERELEDQFHLSITPPTTNPKVLGAAFTLRFPLSWKTEEHPSPDYLIHCQSLGGTGLLTMTVSVRPATAMALPANLTPEWAANLQDVQRSLDFPEPVTKARVLTLPIGKALCVHSLVEPTTDAPYAARFVDFFTRLPGGQIHIISFRVIGQSAEVAQRMLAHYENVMLAVAQTLRLP
jgi:hypothetical protein